jgi:hypothetical protein
MTTANDLKFKDGRIWRVKYLPPDNEIAAKMGFTKAVFEDVTLEVARTLRDCLSDFADGMWSPQKDRDICSLDN